MSPMYNVDPSLGFSVLIAVGRQLTYSATEMFGTPENDAKVTEHADTDSEYKTSTDCWSSYLAKYLGGVRGLFGQDLEVNKRSEAKDWSRQSLRMDPIKLVKDFAGARISPYRHVLSILSADVSGTARKDCGIGHHLRNSAQMWLICNTAETKNRDDWLQTFPYHHNASKRHPWKFVPRSGVLKKDVATMNVIHRSPDQSEKHGEHQGSTVQGLVPWKTVDKENEESGKVTFIKQSRGQRVRTRYLTDGYGIVALWRPRVEVVLTSRPSSRQGQISEGPPESENCQDQNQHTDGRRVADPEDCHGDEDDEDKDYFARMAEAYRKNFCEETADLFSSTMEAGRWDDIVSQLNFTKSKADQLFSNSVSALKQKASEAYDSHPHHTSPPETLFRLQEVLVREAVLALAKQCREQNVVFPQSFEKK